MNAEQVTLYKVILILIRRMYTPEYDKQMIEAIYQYNNGFIEGVNASKRIPEKQCFKLAMYNIKVYLKVKQKS